MSEYLQGEAKRNERRDKKVRKGRFAPRQGGLPMGMPKVLWMQKNAEAKRGDENEKLCWR